MSARAVTDSADVVVQIAASEQKEQPPLQGQALIPWDKVRAQPVTAASRLGVLGIQLPVAIILSIILYYIGMSAMPEAPNATDTEATTAAVQDPFAGNHPFKAGHFFSIVAFMAALLYKVSVNNSLCLPRCAVPVSFPDDEQEFKEIPSQRCAAAYGIALIAASIVFATVVCIAHCTNPEVMEVFASSWLIFMAASELVLSSDLRALGKEKSIVTDIPLTSWAAWFDPHCFFGSYAYDQLEEKKTLLDDEAVQPPDDKDLERKTESESESEPEPLALTRLVATAPQWCFALGGATVVVMISAAIMHSICNQSEMPDVVMDHDLGWFASVLFYPAAVQLVLGLIQSETRTLRQGFALISLMGVIANAASVVCTSIGDESRSSAAPALFAALISAGLLYRPAHSVATPYEWKAQAGLRAVTTAHTQISDGVPADDKGAPSANDGVQL